MLPEHSDLSSPVFLPVTDETCANLLQAGGAKALESLTDPELAAVLVIQNLVQTKEQDLGAVAAEKILAKLLAWAAENRQSTTAGLLSEAQRLFDPRKLYFGLKVLNPLNLRFLLADEISARDYLLPDGQWDFEYKVRRHRSHDPFSQPIVTPRQRERWLSPVSYTHLTLPTICSV